MTTVLTRVAARILLVPTILIALAIMLKGYADTGDGFSAGVIAALAIAIQGVSFGADEFESLPLVKYAAAGTFVGLLLALTVAFSPLLVGDPVMTHWPHAGDPVIHFGTLEFLTAVGFDIGVFLIVFGFGVGTLSTIARALQRQERERSREARKRLRVQNDAHASTAAEGEPR